MISQNDSHHHHQQSFSEIKTDQKGKRAEIRALKRQSTLNVWSREKTKLASFQGTIH